MDVKVMCNVYHCPDEATEHVYCDSHFETLMQEKYDEGVKAGKDEGYQDGYETAEAEYNKKETA